MHTYKVGDYVVSNTKIIAFNYSDEFGNEPVLEKGSIFLVTGLHEDDCDLYYSVIYPNDIKLFIYEDEIVPPLKKGVKHRLTNIFQ